MKKGFTLVEVLAVIVVLALIMLLAITSFGNVREDTNEKSVEIKKDSLVSTAILYANNNMGIFNENDCTADDYEKIGGEVRYCKVIDGFLLVEKNFYQVDEYTEDNKPYLRNDVNGENMLGYEVILYRKNNQVMGKMR